MCLYQPIGHCGPPARSIQEDMADTLLTEATAHPQHGGGQKHLVLFRGQCAHFGFVFFRWSIPFPRLGLITGWMDDLHAQVVIRYGGAGNNARTCNRPLSKMVQLVPAKQTVPEAGLLWDPLVLGDLRAAAPRETVRALMK